MSGQPGVRRFRVNTTLWLAVLAAVFGAGLVLAGVFMVGGLPWVLIVGGAAVVALALTAVPT